MKRGSIYCKSVHIDKPTYKKLKMASALSGETMCEIASECVNKVLKNREESI